MTMYSTVDSLLMDTPNNDVYQITDAALCKHMVSGITASLEPRISIGTRKNPE